MSNKLVIGLVGVKTSGKSTVAEMIKDRFPEAEEGALANKLKNTCSSTFGIPREAFDRQDLKEVPFEKEKLLTKERIMLILESFSVDMDYDTLIEIYRDIINMPLQTPREVAQIVGTEVLRRSGDEDIHCKNLILDSDISIVSDVRFPNEYDYFDHKAEGVNFIPLYIQRNEAEKHVTSASHASERMVFDFCDNCLKISNNGSLQDLENKLEDIYKLIDVFKDKKLDKGVA